MLLENIGSALRESLIEITARFADTAPRVVLALLVLVLGWFLASWIGQAFTSVVNSLKLDGMLGKTGLKELSHKAHFNLSIGNFFGFIVKWGLILVFVKVAFSTLQFEALNDAIDGLIGYIPQVIIAAAILIATALLAQFGERVVTTSAKAADVSSAKILGLTARVVVWVVGVLAACEQLGVLQILQSFAVIIVSGIVLALALALGISFGLGGKEAAMRFVHKIEGDLK